MIKAGATGQEIADYESSQAANDLLGPQGAAWSILNSFGLPSRPRPFTSQRQAMPAKRRQTSADVPPIVPAKPAKNLSGSIEDAASAARTFPYRPDTVSRHALERMQTRHVSYESIREAVSKGRRIFDPSTGKATYTLPAAASSSGRSIIVVRNDVTGNIITVIDKGSK
jgi:hypothetical protein